MTSKLNSGKVVAVRCGQVIVLFYAFNDPKIAHGAITKVRLSHMRHCTVSQLPRRRTGRANLPRAWLHATTQKLTALKSLSRSSDSYHSW